MRCRSSMKASWPSTNGPASHAGLFDVSHMGQLHGHRARARTRRSKRCCRPTVSALKPRPGALFAAARRGWRHPRRSDGHQPHRRGWRTGLLSGRQRRDQVGRYRPLARAPARRDHASTTSTTARCSRCRGPRRLAALERVMRGITGGLWLHEARRWSVRRTRPRGSAARAIPARTGSRSRSPRDQAEQLADALVRRARGQADRPRRARFAAARGRAAALRP